MQTRNVVYRVMSTMVSLALVLGSATVTAAPTLNFTGGEVERLAPSTGMPVPLAVGRYTDNDVSAYGRIQVIRTPVPQGPTILATDAQANSPNTFVPHVITMTTQYAEALYATDLDRDGDLDAIVGSPWINQVAWYENNGKPSPTFTAHIITVATGATSVYAADVDSDGDMDILLSSWDQGIIWYENDGGSPPTFSAHVITTNVQCARSVYAADINGDGHPDVLSASECDDKIAWYENDGGLHPTFTAHDITTSADLARSVHAADVDGDGDVDILSASSNDDKIAWYENSGGLHPTFTAHIITTSADGVVHIDVADVNGDGHLDILSASELDNKIAWYENDGGSPPVFTTHIITTNANFAHSVYAADVDNDGDMDVIASSWGDDRITWYENKGGMPIVFTRHVIATSDDPSIFAADMNGDGDLDILSASYNDGRVAWWEGVTNCEYAPLQAGFVASPITGVAPLTVVFTNTSIGTYPTDLRISSNGTSDATKPPPIVGKPLMPLQISSENLLTNAGFEDGSYSPSGNPTNWSRDMWDIYRNTTLTWDNTESHTGTKSVKITNNEPNDARWIQTVTVQPHTEYQLSGWIKTNNVTHTQETVDAGANLSVYDLPNLRIFTYVGGLFGTNNWTYVSLTFNSGEVTELIVAARLGYISGITTGTAWFDDLRLERIHTASSNILNPGFESGSDSTPDDWWAERIIGDATFEWDTSEAITGSHSAKIAASNPSSVRWAQTVLVDSDSEYELTGWIKTQGVQEISGSYTSGGAKLGAYGMDSYLAAATPGMLDTHGWTNIKVRFITGHTTVAKIACTLGEADPLYARSTSVGTMWCDELTLTKLRTLPRTYLAGQHVALDLYTEDWVFNDAQAYIGHLDAIYEAMSDLVGCVPFNGGLITARADASIYYAMLSGNPVTYGPGHSWQDVVNKYGMDIGLPHEMGHDFDECSQHQYYLGQMLFDNGEHWASLKIAYAYDSLGVTHPELTAELLGQAVPLDEYSRRWFVKVHAQPWIDQGRTDYGNMSNDMYTGLLYSLREQVGWQPFVDTFHYFGSLSDTPPNTDEGKVELFAHTLSRFAGIDLTPHFRSWGFGVSPYIISRWSFGDGITSTLQSPTHTYTTPGVYTATLTVGGPGCSNTKQESIIAQEKHSTYLPLILRNQR